MEGIYAIVDRGRADGCQLLYPFLAVVFEEVVVFFVFEGVELVEVLAFEAVVVGELAGLEEGFFD